MIWRFLAWLRERTYDVEPAQMAMDDYSKPGFTAYPELQAHEDGFVNVRIYSRQPYAWRFRGNDYAARPEFPEPTHRHPTSFRIDEPGKLEAEAIWNKHYAERPYPLSLLHEARVPIAEAQSTVARLMQRYRAS